MLLPLVALAAGSFFSLQSVIGTFEDTVEEAIEEQVPVSRLETLLLKAAMPANDYLILGNPEERKLFALLSQDVDNAFKDAFAAPFALNEEKDLVSSAYKEWKQGKAISEAILALPHPVGHPTASQDMERLDSHIDRAVANLERLYHLTHPEMEDQLEAARTVKRKVSLSIATVFGVGLVTAIIAGLALARSILIPLRQLEEGAVRFGKGALSHRVPLDPGDELGQLAMAFNTMAENLERSQMELKHLSIHDGLTGLYNRHEFDRLLREEIKGTRRYNLPLSLLMLDVDHFKEINDTYGHQAGDKILCTIANLISREVRLVDHVARYGGEEFAIILAETSAADAQATAERIRKTLSNHVITVSQGDKLNLTASIGIAAFPEDAGTEEELIFAADKALYAAKNAGRNQVKRFSKNQVS